MSIKIWNGKMYESKPLNYGVSVGERCKFCSFLDANGFCNVPTEIEGCDIAPFFYWKEIKQEENSNAQKIAQKCDELKNLLIEKNRKYGNSALEPCRIFSRANNVEQILVRIDDKLNRIKNRQNDEDEDVIKDLAGYLILLMIAKENEGGK